MTSSAKRLILCSFPSIWNPEIGLDVLMGSARGSMARSKIIGDRGQPCLLPLVIWNVDEIISATYTLAEGVVYRAMMAEIILSENPNLVKTACRYPQWTLSNAFSASRERSREGVPGLLAKWVILIRRLGVYEVRDDIH